MRNKSTLFLAIFSCLILGLAPFSPEPHLWSKLKWIKGGAIGMKGIDWFDFAFHLSPWLFLIYLIVNYFFNQKK